MSDNENLNTNPVTVSTDASDYPPGSTATIQADGFDAGSTVQFSVQIIDPGADGTIGTADDTLSTPVTWLATDGAATDADATTNGNLTTTFYVDQMYANTTMLLTATEVQVGADGTVTPTGPVATEVFTDSFPGPHVTITKQLSATLGITDDNHDGIIGDAGDVIHYDIFVSNDGIAPLSNVVVVDHMPDGTTQTFAPISLAVGQLVDDVESFTITQTEVDAGSCGNPNSLVNTATVSGNAPPPSNFHVTGTSSVTTVLDYHAALSVTKTADPIADTNHDGFVGDAGDVITYHVTVNNTGDVDLTGVKVVDSLTGDTLTPTGGVAIGVGGSQSFTDTYTITQANVDAGSPGNPDQIVNTASASADQPCATGSSTVTSTIGYTPGLQVVKTADPVSDTNHDGFAGDAGDVLSYHITVSNTGDVDLSGVTVTDTLTGDTLTPPGGIALAVGGSQTYTDSYTITQGDVDAGSCGNPNTLTNTAIAHDSIGDSGSSSVTSTIDHTASLSVVKTANPITDTNNDGFIGDAGDVVTYNVTVNNTGDVDLTGVKVVDSLTGDTLTGAGGISLAVGASQTFTDTYTITQANVDAGSPGNPDQLVNTASASADQPCATGSSSVTSTIDYTPGLTIQKSFDSVTDNNHNGLYDAGDVINYDIKVTNTGDVTLTGVTVMDPLGGGTLASGLTIGVGDSVDLPAQHLITQAEIDAGTCGNPNSVTNTASVSDNQGDTGTSSVTTTLAHDASLSVTKSVISITDTNHDNLVDAGDVINYDVAVTNTGDVTLTGIAVTDLLPNATTEALGGATSLAPGAATAHYSASYVISQGDIDLGGPNGVLINTADVSTDQPCATGSSSVTTATDYQPGISILKTGGVVTDTNHDGFVGDAGDVLSYNIHVANTGDVTLTGVTVVDPLTGGVAASGLTLGVGASTDISTSYTITQGDVDAGSCGNPNTVVNTASVHDDQGDTGSSSVSSTIDHTASLSVVKTANPITDTNHDGFVGDAGDVVTYHVTVTNTGDVDLTGVKVVDSLTGDTLTGAGGVAIGVGGSQTFTDTYTITQANVDAGSKGSPDQLVNTASASADQPCATGSSTVTSIIDYTPGLKVVKTADPVTDTNHDGFAGDAGDVITYHITVSNTGDVDLSGVTVTDSLTGRTLANGVSLAVGGSQTYTDTYTITQANVDTGTCGTPTVLTNTANAHDSNGDTSTSTVTSTIDYTAALKVVKTANPITDTNHDGFVGDAGDVITYHVTVTNTGDVDLTGVKVVDSLTGDILANGVSLAVGGSQTYTDTYTITQANVNAGSAGHPDQLVNTATVTTNQPCATGSSTVTSTIDYTPGLNIVKSVTSITDTNHDGKTDVGDVIHYDIKVTNTGDVTLTGVVVKDPLTGGTLTPAGGAIIAVGGTLDFTTSYTIQSSDVSGGTTPIGQNGSQIYVSHMSMANGYQLVSFTGSSKWSGGSNIITGQQDITYNAGTSYNASTSSQAYAWCVDVFHNINIGSDNIVYNLQALGVNNAATIAKLAEWGNEQLASGPNALISAAVQADIWMTEYGVGLASGTSSALVNEISYINTVVLPTLPAGMGTQLVTNSSYCGTISQSLYVPTSGSGSGTIVNTATVTDNQGDSGSSSVTTLVNFNPGLSIVKSVTCITDTNCDGLTDAGDVITYNIKVTNTGNVTLTGVTVVDPLTGGTLSSNKTLAVGASENIATSYTITQADVDNKGSIDGSGDGKLTNTATVTDNQGDSGSSSVSTPLDYDSGLKIVKTVSSITDTNHDGRTDAGDVINYDIKVTNTGDVTLTGVTVVDPLAGGTIASGKTIAVGATLDITTAKYTVTAADVTSNGNPAGSGTVQNVATVTDSQGDSGSATAVTSIRPALTIVKSVTCVTDKNCDGLVDAGDVITYDIKVTNSGTTTLSGVTVTDPLTGGTVATGVTLAAGKSVDYTKTYTITQSDVDNDGNPAASDKITNTATATDKQGDTATSSASTAIDYAPGIDIEKLVSVDGGVNWYFTAAGYGGNATVAMIAAETGISSTKLHIGTPTATDGSQVQFKVVVTNTGDVTDHNLSVADVSDNPALNANFTFGGSTTVANLAAGASIVSDAIKITAVNGSHTDTATVSGTYGSGAAAGSLPNASDTETYTGTFVSGKCQNTSWWCTDHSSPSSCGGTTWHEATYNGTKGILLGDYTGTAWEGGGSASSPKSLSSIPNGMLFVSDATAYDIVSSTTSSSDPRLQVLSQAITAQLNIDNGMDDPGYNPAGGNSAGHDLISEAVKWLTGAAPFTYSDGSTGDVDVNNDRVLSGGNSNSYEYNMSTNKLTSAAQTTSGKEWTGYVDPINSTPKSGDQEVNGSDVLKALTAFNNLQLVTSAAGDLVGYQNSSGVVDIHANTPDTYWTVLKDQGVISSTHV